MLWRPLRKCIAKCFLSSKADNIPLKEFKYHKLDDVLPKTTSLTKEEASKYFHDMTAIRLMEGEAGRMYMEKEIKGFCHLYTGQESCAVGIEAAISKDDGIITSYRSHGFTYTRGKPMASILSELTGRVTGCSKGRGGSMHTYAHEFYGGNGIVGSQVPVGVGVALAHKLRKNGRLCVSIYGDGAANQGQVFESYNMAALWKLPVIFLCENNLFAMGTAVNRACASTQFYTRGDYIPGIQVDGSCVLSVREAMKFSAEWCREGKGPMVVELVTYRYGGHSMSDPGTSYRTHEDVQNVRKTKDPINYFSSIITEKGLMTSEEMEAIKSKLEAEVEEARKVALSDPFPDAKDLAKYIYTDTPADGDIVRGCDPFTTYSSQN